MSRLISVLPTDSMINPAGPALQPSFDGRGLAVYVLTRRDQPRTRPSCALTSWGPLTGIKLGSRLTLHHDQSNAFLGEYEVVGVRAFDTGESAGVVPYRQVNHRVVK